LSKQPEVDSDKIGIYGRSKGGEMTLIAATLFPQLKYVVANTPSNYVNEGIIGGVRTSGHSSWCFQGKEIQFIKASKRSLLKLMIGLIKKIQWHFVIFINFLLGIIQMRKILMHV
jgi:dienelactone hydrolase